MAGPDGLPHQISQTSTATEWVEDGATEVCMHCHARFGVLQLRRKHHCRRCGKVVCSACSRARELVEEYHPVRPQRVCNSCVAVPSIVEKPEEAVQKALEAIRLGAPHVKPVCAAALGPMVVPTTDEQWEFATLEVRVLEARGLLAADYNLVSKKSSDPYCLLRVGHGVQVRTHTVSATLEPRWDVASSFRLSRADSVLRLEVWDEDTATKDDALGFLELPLSRLPLATALRGWVPLRPPEAQALPGEAPPPGAGQGCAAGAVLLELHVRAVRPWRRLKAFVAPLPPEVRPLPPFDIDKVYGPAMHLVDLVWSRFVSPLLCATLDLLFWASPVRSLLALLLWNFGAHFCLEHYPALAPLLLLGYMLRHRGRSEALEAPVRKHSAPALLDGAELSRQESARHLDYDEAQLGSAVQRLCFVLPSGLKDTLRGLQPLLRSGADGLQLLHDVLVWEHDLSGCLALALVGMALLAELLSFRHLLQLYGSLILLGLSPVLPALSGFVAYCTSLRARAQPKDWEMREEFSDSWLSKDFLDVNNMAVSASPRPRLRHGKTMPALSKVPEIS